MECSRQDMEYSRQQKRFIEAFSEGISGIISVSSGFSYSCPQCLESHGICCEHKAKHMWESGKIQDEGSFSHHPCEICRSSLGGDRYAAHALIDPDKSPKETVHLEVCQDCALYIANGDVPEAWGNDVQEDARFDRFDICEAWHLYARGYHDGQFSSLYRVFGRLERIKFKPSPTLNYNSLSENGKIIYDNLVERKERGK